MAGGRKTKSSGPPPPSKTLVLDNGAYTLKAGFAPPSGDASTAESDPEPRMIPNCIARDRAKKVYIATELSQCRDFGEMQFRRPVDKGFIVNWEAQKAVWDDELFGGKGGLGCEPEDTRLILAEPPNGLPALQANCDQMVFEEFRFASYYRAIGAWESTTMSCRRTRSKLTMRAGPTLNAYNDIQSFFGTTRDPATTPQVPAEIMLLVDSGYSHTIVTPLLHGRPLHSAIRRLDIGGKFLTNYLTRLLSLRHFDMRNDVYIVNEIKETACYVSLDFNGDLEKTWKGARGERRPVYLNGSEGIAKDYVLPDFHARPKGIMRDYDPAAHTKSRKLALGAAGDTAGVNEDIITLRNERFVVPELLLNPMDTGLRQSGLPNLIMQSVSSLPVGLWPGLLANIVVVGGNALFPGFRERLQREVASLAPDDCTVRVAVPENPLTATWKGGVRLAGHESIGKLCVTKAEYEEYGAGWVARKFAAGLPV
ncbi:hypothetical protein jhhlp_001656 [Lomentospora prolificans]|uniref:Actin-like protein ARP6 n=1 Tax=Lomentospora prolificans TaxID=41688 RepID=A0A2N3NIT6_9PEZI|nr:hypothetical protein jhhlp_001656 [Lomentospora prolificans]